MIEVALDVLSILEYPVKGVDHRTERSAAFVKQTFHYV